MESPVWHVIGTLAVVAFAAAILFVLMARRWFRSSDSEEVKLGAKVLGLLGGAQTARAVEAEMARRGVR